MYLSENINDKTKVVGRLAGNSMILSSVYNIGRPFIMGALNMFNSIISMLMGQTVPETSRQATDQNEGGLKCPLSGHANMFLSNDSGTVGYCALQLQRGRIIVIDNELNESMIVNKKYVIAHTPNVSLKRQLGGNARNLNDVFFEFPTRLGNN